MDWPSVVEALATALGAVFAIFASVFAYRAYREQQKANLELQKSNRLLEVDSAYKRIADAIERIQNRFFNDIVFHSVPTSTHNSLHRTERGVEALKMNVLHFTNRNLSFHSNGSLRENTMQRFYFEAYSRESANGVDSVLTLILLDIKVVMNDIERSKNILCFRANTLKYSVLIFYVSCISFFVQWLIKVDESNLSEKSISYLARLKEVEDAIKDYEKSLPNLSELLLNSNPPATSRALSAFGR